jgi:hypothetical protein
MFASFRFIHLHCASNLGTLDAPREGYDVGAEPEDGVWWTYPKDGRTKQVLGPEMSPRRCKLTELTLCRIPGKPQSILSLLPSLFINAHEYNFCMMH